MKTSDFDYDLPVQCIAQNPAEPRDAARLLVLDRGRGETRHTIFSEIESYLKPADLLVMNETRVLPARLIGKKEPGGGRAEILLLRKLEDQVWEAMVGGKGLGVGRRVSFSFGPGLEVLSIMNDARRLVRFDAPVEPFLMQIGEMPLPPYIRSSTAPPERYQTVYAKREGSAAAPTAGLHFTPALLERLQHMGVAVGYVTLHIGLDTFAPVREEYPGDHVIHTEWCQMPPETAHLINDTTVHGGRVICVGTTSVRTVESAANHAAPGERVGAFEGDTSLYILPGYTFKAVDAIITNFHLPKSTLIMMISAFAGREKVLETYELARDMGYRFYSFGDAMLIV